MSDFDEYLTRFGLRDAPVFEVPEERGADWPTIVVKHGKYVAVVQLMGLTDHLCIDVHPFVDEAKARAGVFGMEEGRRYELGDDTPGTSHKWNATAMVSVLVGEQATRATPFCYDDQLAKAEAWAGGVLWRLENRLEVESAIEHFRDRPGFWSDLKEILIAALQEEVLDLPEVVESVVLLTEEIAGEEFCRVEVHFAGEPGKTDPVFTRYLRVDDLISTDDDGPIAASEALAKLALAINDAVTGSRT